MNINLLLYHFNFFLFHDPMATTNDSDEELFRELEKDDDHLTDRFREARMATIKKEYT